MRPEARHESIAPIASLLRSLIRVLPTRSSAPACLTDGRTAAVCWLPCTRAVGNVDEARDALNPCLLLFC